MGKGMGMNKKLPFLGHSKSLDPKLSSSHPPWPWPSCVHIKTLSFRASDDHFRTFNSAFLDSEITPSDSFVTLSSTSDRFSTMSEDYGDSLETVIRGLRSDRLFFKPENSSSLVSMETQHKGCSNPSVVEEEEEQQQEQEEEEEQQQQEQQEEGEGEGEEGERERGGELGYKESEMLSMESENPYEDFRNSMEEMVEAHGVKDWKGLEELLGCYLKINGKNNHGYIMGAFIDLLVSLSFVSSASTNTTTPTTTISSSSDLSTNSNYSSPSSPLSLPSSSLTTPCLSSILDHADDVEDQDDHKGAQHHSVDDQLVPSLVSLSIS